MVRLSLACGFLVAVGWLYSWKPSSFPAQELRRQPTELYSELSDALLKGQLHLARQPDPRLVALPDPYDPAQNAPYRVDNLSYFRGHYYLYMGAAPALLLFIPFKLLTGYYLPQEWAAIAFCLIGLAASLGTVWHLGKYCRQSISSGTTASIAVALALASGYYAVLPGSLAQEVAIAAGYAFAMTALLACARALIAPRAWIWFAMASLALGAAIASRPEYVFASLALLPPLLAWQEAQDRRWELVFWRTAAAAALPLGGVVLGLLVYNRARFGDVFEFGQHYMLGGWNQRQLTNGAAGIVGGNAWRYLLAPGHYSRAFPFVTTGTPLAIGALRNVPWLWLVPIAIWALAKKSIGAPVRAVGISALVLATANLLVLLFLPSGNADLSAGSANSRYILDFLPGLILFTSIGMLAADQLAKSSLPRRFGLATAMGLAAMGSLLSGLSLGFERFPPATYLPLSFVLDLPDYLLREFRPASFGPLRMEVTFPTGAIGRYEPLVTTGTAGTANLLYVFYASEHEIQLGFIGTGIKGPLSSPITLPPGPVHLLSISLGSLYPPIGYPSLAGLTESQVEFLKREVQVAIDGRLVFDAPSFFYPAAASSVRFGENSALPDYTVGKFSGRIWSEQRAAIVALPGSPVRPEAYGPLRLQLHFPSGQAGRCEPLVVTGVPQAGDFVYVRYLDARHVRFGLDHWGGSGAESGPVEIDFSLPHTVEISMGSLLPAIGRPQLGVLTREEQEKLKRQVRLVLDGRTVFSADRGTYDSSSYDVTVGRNAIGGSVCDYAYTGTIEKTERLSPTLAAQGEAGSPSR